MAINLELPRKMHAVIDKAHQGAAEMMRPIARKYHLNEHAYPVELDTLANLFSGAAESNALGIAGAEAFRAGEAGTKTATGPTCRRCYRHWRPVGVTRPCCCRSPTRTWATRRSSVWPPTNSWTGWAGSGRRWPSPNRIRVRFGGGNHHAKLDGDEYVINGEKIFVTAGSRATHIVVWATLDKSKGRPAIKSFIVPREHPGVTVERLENKLGIKGSDTAVIRFDNARIPKDNLLGNPEIEQARASPG